MPGQSMFDHQMSHIVSTLSATEKELAMTPSEIQVERAHVEMIREWAIRYRFIHQDLDELIGRADLWLADLDDVAH